MAEVEQGAVDPGLAAAVAAADRGEAVAQVGPDGAVHVGIPPAQTPEQLLASVEAAHWIGAAIQFGSIARTALPDRIATHWTDARLEDLGKALARCAQHYGWKFGAFLNHPLMGLGAAAFPLAWPILEPYVKAQMEAAKKKNEQVEAVINDEVRRATEAANAAHAAQKQTPPRVEPIG